jgi:hypothetical protein
VAHVAHAPQRAIPASLPSEDDLVVLDDAITLDDEAETTGPAPVVAPASPVAAAGAGALATSTPKKITFNADAIARNRQWKRQTTSSGHGACRVKTFHGKCSDQGLEYLDDAINMFLDEHPEIEVKFVQSNIGMFDGKFKDFALIVNVWY